MSGTVTPAVPETPAVQATPIAAPPAAPLPVAGASSEPAAGTQPPGGDAPATPPAALSSPEVPPSLMATPPPEPAQPAEAAAEAPPPAPAEPLPLPSFEPFVLPDGVSLDAERQTQFTNALAEIETRTIANPAELHNALQEAGQKMLDLYLEEGKNLETTLRSQLEPAIKDEITQANMQVWLDMRKEWAKEVHADPELGRGDKHQMEDTARLAGSVLDLYGSEVGADRLGSLRDAMTITGAGDHPEFWRFMKWVAGRSVENTRMLAAPPAQQQIPMTRAQRMYRSSIPVNGAA